MATNSGGTNKPGSDGSDAGSSGSKGNDPIQPGSSNPFAAMADDELFLILDLMDAPALLTTATAFGKKDARIVEYIKATKFYIRIDSTILDPNATGQTGTVVDFVRLQPDEKFDKQKRPAANDKTWKNLNLIQAIRRMPREWLKYATEVVIWFSDDCNDGNTKWILDKPDEQLHDAPSSHPPAKLHLINTSHAYAVKQETNIPRWGSNDMPFRDVVQKTCPVLHYAYTGDATNAWTYDGSLPYRRCPEPACHDLDCPWRGQPMGKLHSCLLEKEELKRKLSIAEAKLRMCEQTKTQHVNCSTNESTLREQLKSAVDQHSNCDRTRASLQGQSNELAGKLHAAQDELQAASCEFQSTIAERDDIIAKLIRINKNGRNTLSEADSIQVPKKAKSTRDPELLQQLPTEDDEVEEQPSQNDDDNQ